jgi:hypothetical protein
MTAAGQKRKGKQTAQVTTLAIEENLERAIVTTVKDPSAQSVGVPEAVVEDHCSDSNKKRKATPTRSADQAKTAEQSCQTHRVSCARTVAVSGLTRQ